MATFAKLDKNNMVLQVLMVNNNELLNDENIEDPQKGINFLLQHYGEDTVWVQSSWNNRIRKNYPGPGYTYDSIRDAFIPPKPLEGTWNLNEETCLWEAPIPKPNDGNLYEWDEPTLSWKEITA